MSKLEKTECHILVNKNGTCTLDVQKNGKSTEKTKFETKNDAVDYSKNIVYDSYLRNPKVLHFIFVEYKK